MPESSTFQTLTEAAIEAMQRLDVCRALYAHLTDPLAAECGEHHLQMPEPLGDDLGIAQRLPAPAGNHVLGQVHEVVAM